MASTGKKIIIGSVAVTVLGLVVVGILIGWNSTKRVGEGYITQNLKTVAAEEIQYYNTHQRTFGTFDQMVQEEMLTAMFSGDPPVVDDYVLTLKVTPKTTGNQSFYMLNADPQDVGNGRRHFYLDSSSGLLHVNSDRPAGPSDPPPPE